MKRSSAASGVCTRSRPVTARQCSTVRSSSALALSTLESSEASEASGDTAITSVRAWNAAAKQGSSPAPCSWAGLPASQAARSQVHSLGGWEKAALTPAPSQQGEAALIRPSAHEVTT